MASRGVQPKIFDNDGGLATVTDSATGIKTTYYYDFVDRLESYNQKIGDSTILKLEYGYDLENRLTSETWYFPGSNAYVNSYTYNDDGTVQGMGSGVMGTGYTYDGLGRLTRIDSEINVSDREYTYRTDGAVTTSQVTKLNYPHLLGGYTFEYTYDVNGNIASYATGYTSDGNRITDSTEYTYDAQNQLVRAEGSQIYTYTYNSGGNLVTAFDGTKTHTYSYYAGSWGDLLQYYDGQEIVYDKMGNPTSYYNGTRWTFTWQNGRELTRATKTGTEVNYTYDADGMRKTKTVNGVTHTYYYTGGRLLREVYDGTILDFFYNANGTPIAMRQSAVGSTNYTIYYYITNLQGDVIRLVDHLGQTAAYYRYDPYGKVIEASGSHANINPLRYRSYYYDTDTELYYLQSRYYDPQVGRFINADAYTSTGQGILGNNMFAYCNNNPVMGTDPYGNAPEWWQWTISGAMVLTGIAMVATGVGGVAGGALICAGANSIIGSYTSEAAGGSSTAGWAGGMITGAISGAGAGVAGELFIRATNTVNAACIGNLVASGATAFGSGMLGSATGQFVTASIDGTQLDPQTVAVSSVTNGAVNCLSGLGAGMGNAIQSAPLNSTTTTGLANALTAAWSVAVEAVCDFLGTVAGFFS